MDKILPARNRAKMQRLSIMLRKRFSIWCGRCSPSLLSPNIDGPGHMSVRLALACLFTISNPLFCMAENWPGWRGPRGDGTSIGEDVPIHWDVESGKNILWKATVPGTGHASPVVWGNRIFIATCLEDEQQRVLICLDSGVRARDSGGRRYSSRHSNLDIG